MPAVTVTGANNAVLTVSLDGTTNFALAQQFATLVNNAAASGILSASVLTATGVAPVPAGFLGEAQVTSSLSNLAWPGVDSVMLDVAAGATTISAQAVATPVSLLAGSGGVTFNAGPGLTTLIAGGGSNTFNGYVAPGGITTLPGAGSSTLNMVATGAGNDTITTGTGNFDIDPGAGSNVVVLGTGINYVNSLGQDLIMGGPAHTTAGVPDASTIYLSGTGATVVGGTGLLDILASNGITSPGGGMDSITLGSGGGTITGIAHSTLNLAGIASVAAGGSDTISVGAATATVQGDTTAGGAGPTLVNGPTGTGSLMFIGGTAGSTVAGGAVAVTVAGALGGSVTFTGAASGNLFMVSGAAGSASLIDASAATGASTFVTGSAAATVLGGSGADLFMIGGAASSLTGGAGGVNTFEFQATATGGATDVITDFKATDKLSISGYTLNGAAVLPGASVAGGSTTITLSDQTKIVLQNFATLTGGNFS